MKAKIPPHRRRDRRSENSRCWWPRKRNPQLDLREAGARVEGFAPQHFTVRYGMIERKAYPLFWPEGWKRTASRKFGHFKTARQWISVHDATRRVLNEFRHMGVKDDDIIVST